jgi:hypothetical protein
VTRLVVVSTSVVSVFAETTSVEASQADVDSFIEILRWVSHLPLWRIESVLGCRSTEYTLLYVLDLLVLEEREHSIDRGAYIEHSFQRR